MRYFVTGATGFIGGHLVRQLRAEGHAVVALVRDPRRAQALADLGVELAAGDITERASLSAPMTGVDGVFHLAAWYKVGSRHQAQAERINVEGTRNVLETMRDLGIPKGVYTSTLAVYSDTRGRIVDEGYHYTGPHLSEYDRTKWRAHYEVAEPLIQQGLPLVRVLPGVVYGPGDTSAIGATFAQYLQGRLPSLPSRTALCWSHVDDVARGHRLAMEKGRPGESYILAGPVHGLEEVFALAEAITGVKAPAMRVPPELMRGLARLVAPLERVLQLPDAYTAEGLRVTAGVTYLGSNAKACKELGYTVRPLAEGLEETLRHQMAALQK